MAGTFVDGERLEKGGKRKLEVGRSVITIGRCTMTLQLMRQKLVGPEGRGGETADSLEMMCLTQPCVSSLVNPAASHMHAQQDMAMRETRAPSSPGAAVSHCNITAPEKAVRGLDAGR